jgi:hypothetical protein
MREQQIRTVLGQHGSASAAGDLDAEGDIYEENAVCEYPQSGERKSGKENLESLRGPHPGRAGGFIALGRRNAAFGAEEQTGRP